MRSYNGHPLLVNMPAQRLFKTSNQEAVRITLNYPDSVIGVADVYVHKNCLTHVGGDGINAEFNVLLIDDEYHLYYPVQNKDSGLLELKKSEKAVPVSEICKLAEDTRQYHNNHIVKQSKSSHHAKRGEEFGMIALSTKNIVTLDYLELE